MSRATISAAEMKFNRKYEIVPHVAVMGAGL